MIREYPVISLNWITLQIVVLWTSDAPIAHNRRWPQINVPLVIVRPETKVRGIKKAGKF